MEQSADKTSLGVFQTPAYLVDDRSSLAIKLQQLLQSFLLPFSEKPLIGQLAVPSSILRPTGFIDKVFLARCFSKSQHFGSDLLLSTDLR